MVGTKNSGNGNVDLDTKGKQTGAKTDEGKVRQLLGRNLFPKDASIVHKLKAKGCNECPLRPRMIKKIDRKTQEEYLEMISGQCAHFQADHQCPLTYEDHVKALKTYFNYVENFDPLKLQQTLAMKTLENAELCKAKEVLQTTSPGFYTLKFMELATENLTNYNKIVNGEINKNINVNVNLSDAIVEAWKFEEEDKKIIDITNNTPEEGSRQ